MGQRVFHTVQEENADEIEAEACTSHYQNELGILDL